MILLDKEQAIYQDFHMHTCFDDGADTPEDMILSAIDKGLKRVGVSLHSVVDSSIQEYVDFEKEKNFCIDMARLKEKYKDKIEIYCGIEWDLCTLKSVGKYDYVIGSSHFIKMDGKYFFIDRSETEFLRTAREGFNGDFYAFSEKYFSQLEELAENINFDIIGHIDLITKFNQNDKYFDTKNPRYVNAYQKAIDKLLKTGKPFEINMGAISRGYRTEPYPSLDILNYIKSKGGKFIFSSDSHAKENVAFQYEKWAHLIG